MTKKKSVVYKGKQYYAGTYLHKGLKVAQKKTRQADFVRGVGADVGKSMKQWISRGLISKTGTTRARYIKTTAEGNKLLRLLDDPSKSTEKLKRVKRPPASLSVEEEKMLHQFDPRKMTVGYMDFEDKRNYAKKIGVDGVAGLNRVFSSLSKKNFIYYDSHDRQYYLKRKGINFLKKK